MNEPRENIIVIGGAVVAVLLQILLAPHIAIMSIVPNFIMAFVLTVSVLRPTNLTPAFAFVLGLLYDLMGNSAVGAMAFMLVLVSFAAQKVFTVLNNDTMFMPILVIVVATFVAEIGYAIFMMVTGVGVGFVDAFVYRALPCAWYNSVLALICYPLMARLLSGGNFKKKGAGHSDMTIIR